jgi:hypothetical protein
MRLMWEISLFTLLLQAYFPASQAAAADCPKIELIYQPPFSQINSTCDRTNKYGLEDGIVVRRADGGFQLIAAEMYDDPMWVNMRLGIWQSADGMTWRKVRSIRKSTGNFGTYCCSAA